MRAMSYIRPDPVIWAEVIDHAFAVNPIKDMEQEITHLGSKTGLLVCERTHTHTHFHNILIGSKDPVSPFGPLCVCIYMCVCVTEPLNHS